MCTTQFHFITYNCHLFPNPIKSLNLNFSTWYFMEGPREQAIRQYLASIPQFSAPSQVIQVVALQEVWDRGFTNDIIDYVAKQGSYSREYAIGIGDCIGYTEGESISSAIYCGAVNPSGLILLADPSCRKFRDTNAYNYRIECIADAVSPGWSPQDLPVAKGFLEAKLDYFCSNNKQHSLLLFNTHMPTSYGTYTASLQCCFDTLANEIKSFQRAGNHEQFATVVLGDFNVDYYNEKQNINDNGTMINEYQDAIVNRLLNGTGLTSVPVAAGVWENPSANTVWTKFNPGNDKTQALMDYIFIADSTDQPQSMTVVADSVDFIVPSAANDYALTVVDENDATWNCSDHFPLEATISVTAQD